MAATSARVMLSLGRNSPLLPMNTFSPVRTSTDFSVGFADVAQVELIVGAGDGHEERLMTSASTSARIFLRFLMWVFPSFKIAGKAGSGNRPKKLRKTAENGLYQSTYPGRKGRRKPYGARGWEALEEWAGSVFLETGSRRIIYVNQYRYECWNYRGCTGHLGW